MRSSPILSAPLDESERNHSSLISICDLVKTFHTTSGDFDALRGVSLDLCSGEFVSVVGRSGSGKSTLVNMITGIDRPTSGRVVIGGTDVLRMNESEMARWRGRNLGIVFQFYQLLPMLSLFENVLVPMDFAGVIPVEERPARALELLRLVGLESQADKMPAAVSGGQQQAAAVARALANDPPIVIADEPTGNLDSRAAEDVLGIFQQLSQRGSTIIIVTHDPALARQTRRTIRLADGLIVSDEVNRC